MVRDLVGRSAARDCRTTARCVAAIGVPGNRRRFAAAIPIVLLGLMFFGVLSLAVAGPIQDGRRGAGPSGHATASSEVVEGTPQGERGTGTVAGPTGEESPTESAYWSERLEGRVVWAAAALQRQFGISTVPEARERVLAIQTQEGELVPLVENLRGRAFRTDERLRHMDLVLNVRRYKKQPFAQILRIYQRIDGQLYEVDYWCDVCAIVMFESGPCSCCQDLNRLRRRWVDPQTGETTQREFDAASAGTADPSAPDGR